MDPEWTLRENEQNVIHQGLLGSGGYGEVHKVPNIPDTSANALDAQYQFGRGTQLRKQSLTNSILRVR